MITAAAAGRPTSLLIFQFDRIQSSDSSDPSYAGP
jgi:hypothetical protein